MITWMQVFSSQPNAPELQMGGFVPNDDPIQLLGIEGLGPVKADLVSVPSATGRGELPQGVSTGKRNIVLTLGLNPDWADQSMTSLRQQLYAYFMPEQKVKLRFFSDYLPTVDIDGTVESFDPNMFSQDPEIQISIVCFKPDFVAIHPTVRTGMVNDGAITFNYPGSVPTGFELRVDSAVGLPSFEGNIRVMNNTPITAQDFVVIAVAVNEGKYFKLSTVKQSRYVRNVLVADDTITNLLDKMAPYSVWPELKPGQNTFVVEASNTGQTWSLVYFNRFGGL